MNDAQLYQKSNSLQKRDTLRCLKKNSMKIKWKKCGRVLDIGCADGSVTNILKSFIPDTFEKIIGCDISEKMVKFANKHYGDDQTSFHILDIEGDLPEDMREGFDHVFSFYTLHWVKKQVKAFQNIYNLLAEKGDCLLLFIGHTPIFDVYRTLARQPKWSQWLKDVDRFVSPYHDSLNPEKEIIRIMEKIGYINISVKCEEAIYKYEDINVLKKSVRAVNPFNIPNNCYEDFLKDYLDVVESMRMIDVVNNNIKISFSYKLLVVYASKGKPEHISTLKLNNSANP